MPTRFPAGLNALPGDHALSGLPLPLMAKDWGILYDDFTLPTTPVISSTGGIGWNYINYTAAGAITYVGSGATAAANHFGGLNVTTAANANGGIYLYQGNGLAEGIAGNVSLGTPTGAKARDWIVSARLSQSVATTSGFAVGVVTTGEINDGAGTVLDLATAATAITNGVLIRKASGATAVIVDLYSGGSKLITSQTVAANASLAVGTMNRYTVWYKASQNKLYCYFNDILAASATPSAAIPTTTCGFVFGTRADGSNATARSVIFDDVLCAVKVGR